jgi:tRNA (adenine37-N6)-methyltransferase
MTNSANMQPIPIQPIGVVEASVSDVMGSPDYDTPCAIRIFPQFLPGLAGIERFSHFHVIYHQNRAAEWKKERNWPIDNPLVVPPPDPRAGSGVFTIRAPCRPACLGSSVVKLQSVEGDRLIITGLDALDGTPVLDIKMYNPEFDCFHDATIPDGWKPGMQRRYQSSK